MTKHKISAGMLLYRRQRDGAEVLLAHPGGPYWTNHDEGAWTLPKGEPEPGEDLCKCAIRELAEETGLSASGELLPLGQVRQANAKVVHAWACQENVPDGFVHHSNTFEIEWPPGSGQRRRFPEVDRAQFFPLPAAARKINHAQREFLRRLAQHLGEPSDW